MLFVEKEDPAASPPAGGIWIGGGAALRVLLALLALCFARVTEFEAERAYGFSPCTPPPPPPWLALPSVLAELPPLRLDGARPIPLIRGL